MPLRRSLNRRTVLGMAAAAALPAAVRAAEGDAYTLRMNTADPPDHHNTLAAIHFASAIGRRSNGRLKIEVYPSGQLGKEQNVVDMLTAGVADLSVDASTAFEQLFPAFLIFSLPFLFKDEASAYAILGGPLGQEIFAQLEPKGLVGLAWGNGGFKQIETVTRTITTPDDMKGARIRIVGGAINVATFQALGALPVTIDLTEVYTALTQRTIEAVDLPVASFSDHKLYNVAKHMAMTNHLFAASPIVANKRKLEGLPAPLQRIVREEGRAVMPFWRTLVAQRTAERAQILKTNGVVSSEIKYPVFRKAVDPVYAGGQARIGGDFLERVMRVASSK